ncbi:hypothetical protein [Fibrobacter sp. UWH4]|jgi:hypothetical protein|uniref:hypothetical protein n=1 Tax=Fibrobacter sp. UWH4 TaxID=1896210 RepID=UPI0009167666|nr:hypothetical protein [Fibrobacter sp. UWH4]SHK64041.1 hypothetical protein SAMN05720762_102382 [Fibrobacter sp. UWH4]
MRNEENISWKQKMKKRLPLLIFLTISTTIFFLASALLLDESYKDIIIIAMIWALPLFIH